MGEIFKNAGENTGDKPKCFGKTGGGTYLGGNCTIDVDIIQLM